ncbi:MAG: hypothetical protein K0S92_830, partial [Desertimonas sp.]|nr:hypothetical protein [Desertimonas sp.]
MTTKTETETDELAGDEVEDATPLSLWTWGLSGQPAR